MVNEMSNPKLLSTINMVGPSTDKGVKKVAIQKEGYFPVLYDVKPEYTIEYVVADICAKWQTLQKPEQFALQYLDTKIYVTEENRGDIRDGDLFTITFNPELTAAKFLSDIEQPDLAKKRQALKDLAGVNDNAGQADDPLFAKEFINRNGINTLKNIIESAVEPGDIIACAMSAIQELLEHQFTTWEGSVSQFFVEKVIDYANKTDGDVNVVQKALSLLDNMVTVSTTYFVLVMNKVIPTNLVKHLSNSNENVQLSTMSLCNSIILRMEHNNRKKFTNDLLEKGYLQALHKIVASSAVKPLLNGMSHQLYVYQFLIIGLYQSRMNTKPDFGDSKVLSDLHKIYNIAFDSAPTSKEKGMGKADFTRLGFQHGDAPLIDFNESPPGVLAYDVMMYFVEKHQDQYVKVILENFGRDTEYECPFGKCTKHLTKILCELLEVGAPMSDTSVDFQPMVFVTANILEELYCVSIQLLNKTWKEMRATSQDFSRVIGVVKDQLKRVLSKRPENIEKFKTEAFSLNYQAILRLMQQEAQERTILDSQTKPVMELREQIEPEIRELVRQQRLARLVEGTSFSLFSTRGKLKNTYRFCCLSSNHRFLHYGDTEGNTSDSRSISSDSLPNKVPLSEVNRIDIGKDCPNVKNLKKGFIPLAFSIFHGQEEHLDFIAPNEELFSVWTDTLSFLIGKEIISEKFKEDLEMLLNMEMKLLLLDLENVRIPDVPPQVPPEPENYSFYYPDS